jgi:histidine phosphotransferase ChpT
LATIGDAPLGAAGSAGASIDLGDAEGVARGMLEDDKTKLAWNLPRVLLGKNRVKLLLNMLLLAGSTIPRGGSLTVDAVGQGDTLGFRITAAGLNARTRGRCRRSSRATPAALWSTGP